MIRCDNINHAILRDHSDGYNVTKPQASMSLDNQ